MTHTLIPELIDKFVEIWNDHKGSDLLELRTLVEGMKALFFEAGKEQGKRFHKWQLRLLTWIVQVKADAGEINGIDLVERIRHRRLGDIEQFLKEQGIKYEVRKEKTGVPLRAVRITYHFL